MESLHALYLHPKKENPILLASTLCQAYERGGGEGFSNFRNGEEILPLQEEGLWLEILVALGGEKKRRGFGMALPKARGGEEKMPVSGHSVKRERRGTRTAMHLGRERGEKRGNWTSRQGRLKKEGKRVKKKITCRRQFAPDHLKEGKGTAWSPQIIAEGGRKRGRNR